MHVSEGLPAYPSTVTLSPGTTPAGGSIISIFSGEEAHITIASDSIPRILREGEGEGVEVLDYCEVEMSSLGRLEVAQHYYQAVLSKGEER